MNLKPKTPKPKKSRAERAAALLRYGPEPEFGKLVPLTSAELGEFYNWHHYVTDRAEGLEWLYTWLESHDGKRYEAIRKIKERRIADSFFTKARLLLLGYQVPGIRQQLIEGLDDLIRIQAVVDDVEYEVDEEGNIILLDSQDEPKDLPVKKESAKVREAFDELYGLLDELTGGATFTPYEYITEHMLPTSAYRPALVHFTALLKEQEEYLEGYDDETKRYLAGLDASTKAHDKKVYAADKAGHQKRLKALQSLVSDLDRLLGNAKKARKPRKPKVKSVEKRISLLKYQKEDTDLKIVSIDPAKILGAQELWTYNTKYNLLTVYRGAALDVKGTTLLGWDEKTSYGKKLGRKPEVHLTGILQATKTRMKKVFEEIKGDAQSVNGRINENTVLLRAL